MLSPVRTLLLILCVTSVVALAACAPASTPSSTAASTASAAPPGLGQEVRNNPAQPVFLAWPRSRRPELGEAIQRDLKAREAAFLADYAPSDEAPPELHATWSTVVDAPGAVLGIRSEVYEFAGASGATSSEALYVDRAAGSLWRGSDLVAPAERVAFVDAVVQALEHNGRVVDDVVSGATGAAIEPEAVAARLLDDLTFTAAGDLVVRVGDGVLLPFSEGRSRRSSRPCSQRRC